MKLLLLVGAMLGWSLGTALSYEKGNAWPTCFWHGCLAAYLTALLMRWWGRAWRKSLEQSLQEREQAQSAIVAAVTSPKVSRP
jgi:hypothetical protein